MMRSTVTLRVPAVSLAGMLLQLLLARHVQAHGRLSIPRARQVIAWNNNQFYNPNGGNGAQTGSVGEKHRGSFDPAASEQARSRHMHVLGQKSQDAI